MYDLLKKIGGGGKLFVVKEEEHTQAYGGFCGGREWKGRAKGPQGGTVDFKVSYEE